MIIIRLSGGLGNQLFQYAAGLQLTSGDRDIIHLFDKHLANYSTKRLNTLALLFENELNLISKLPKFYELIFRFRINKLIPLFNNIYSDSSFDKVNKNRLVKISKKIYLDGYFQNCLTISSGLSYLVNNLQKRSTIRVDNAYKEIIKSNSKIDEIVALHIRRGDYLKKEVSNIYYVLTEGYYENAFFKLKMLGKNIKTCVVFSDEPAKLNFSMFVSAIRVSDFGLSDWEEFLLMRMFKNFIIANSTFSFMGSLASLHLDRTIIAPQSWSKLPSENDKWISNLKFINSYIV